MLDTFHPRGVRTLIVLLADLDGGAATPQGCQTYMAENGLEDDDRVIFALDPTGAAKEYYQGGTSTSLSIITSDIGEIVFKEAMPDATGVYYHVERELEEYFERLATAH